MDPNQDSVRSMATLLVMDENEDNTTLNRNNVPATNGIIPKLTTQTSQTSNTSKLSQNSADGSDNDPADSVFGDVPLNDTPARRVHRDSVTLEQHIPDSPSPCPAFTRQPSLRSQLSVTSSQKEPEKRELKLKTFVSFLFIIIVTGVSVVLHFAKAKHYEAVLGRKIIVHEDTRQIQYQNQQRHDVLLGTFGVGIPDNMLPHDCSVDKDRKTHLCLRWKEYSEVNVTYWEEGSSKCFDVNWRSINRHVPLKDCFDLNLGKVEWYGGWIDGEQSWPIRNASIPMQPYITGQMRNGGSFGPVLERYWLSSKGASVFSTDRTTPLHVSWNAPVVNGNETEGDGQLCLVSGYNHPLYTPDEHQDVWLNYTVCVSSNVLDVHHLSLQRIEDISNVSSAGAPDMDLFTAPVWSPTKVLQNNFSQSSLQDLGQRLANLNLPIGVLMLGDQWQGQRGDFEFNRTTFTNVSGLLQSLKRQLTCVVGLGIDPYVAIHSKNFADIASQGLLVKDASGLAPGLFKWTDPSYSDQPQLVGALDVTSYDTVSWLEEKLRVLKSESSIDLVKFQGGAATLLPYAASLGENRTNENLFTYDYGVVAWSNSNPAIVDSATHLQTHPVIVRVHITSLTQAIPTVLTMGILGYPYILAEFNEQLGSKELYIRSIQLSAFLPVMHISTLPDEFGTDVVDIVRKMISLHQHLVHPRVVRIAGGETPMDPVIRPLWWIAPDDPDAARIDSQFVIGDDLIVAPILQPGTYQRNVYLPKGRWFDKTNAEFQGPRWLKDYPVPLGDIAYFTSH